MPTGCSVASPGAILFCELFFCSLYCFLVCGVKVFGFRCVYAVCSFAACTMFVWVWGFRHESSSLHWPSNFRFYTVPKTISFSSLMNCKLIASCSQIDHKTSSFSIDFGSNGFLCAGSSCLRPHRPPSCCECMEWLSLTYPPLLDPGLCPGQTRRRARPSMQTDPRSWPTTSSRSCRWVSNP